MAHTEADETIVAVFAALKELSELRERYDSLVSEVRHRSDSLLASRGSYTVAISLQAYFNITRARHTMGRNAISQLQYPMKMESSLHVHATRYKNCRTSKEKSMIIYSHSAHRPKD